MALGNRLFALVFVGFSALTACSGTTDSGAEATEEPLTQVSDAQREAAQSEDLGDLHFDHLTPTTTKMMRASRFWMHEQSKESKYPRPRMCASNVSKVLFMSDVTRYDQQGVRALLADVSAAKGRVTKLPRTRRDLVAALNALDHGHLPAGMLVAGMNVHSSNPGDQHVGILGHEDADGTVWVYHNNWYRPENEGGRRLPFMVSEENLKRGFLRQWMATPWLKITRDASGLITDAQVLIPAIDDMNPLHPDYQVTVAILPEVARELE